jgi:hypothetical protein
MTNNFDEMRTEFSEIRNALFHAQQCCEVWWLLEGSHDLRAQVIGAFDDLPVVYETLRPALYTSLIIKICSVFATGSEDITLRHIPGADQDPDFSRIWEIGRRLYKLRSKLIAHLDSRCDPDLVARDTGLTYDALREFSANAVSLFNRLAERHQETGVPDFGISEELSIFLSRLNQK